MRQFLVKLDVAYWSDNYPSETYPGTEVSFKIKADRVIICDLFQNHWLLMACGCKKKDVKYRYRDVFVFEGNRKVKGGYYFKRNHSLDVRGLGDVLNDFKDKEVGFVCEPYKGELHKCSRLLIEEVVNGSRIKIVDLDLRNNKLYGESIDGFDTASGIISYKKRTECADSHFYFLDSVEKED